MALRIVQFPALNDNYNYLLHDEASGVTAAVDPSEAAPTVQALRRNGWSLDIILNTHHHHDHVGGNRDLQAAYGCEIIGFEGDAGRIPAITQLVKAGDGVQVGESRAEVFFVPGHTSGHIAYYFSEDAALFCGDTMFAMGCGRLFEGTPAQMHDSLQQLAQLPSDTRIYCAHEYTEANGRFALTVEPQNVDLRQRMVNVKALRARNEPTVPSQLGEELATNPFLRTDSAAIRETLQMRDADAVEVFAEIRRRKDRF